MQVETFTGVGAERQANQAAPVRGHEVDQFWRDVFRGDGQVAFVFAVFVVDHDKHPARFEIFNRFGNGDKWHKVQLPVYRTVCLRKMNQSWWRRILESMRRALSGGVRQQVTLFGVIYSLAIVLVGTAAFLSGNNLVFLILSVLFSAMLVSGFISRLSLAALRLEFFLPDHIAARRVMQCHVAIENEKWLMPSFSIHLSRIEVTGRKVESIVYMPVIAPKSRVEAPLELMFPKRGTQQNNQFLFSTRFPFGFTERRIEVEVKHDILIYPCLDPQPGFEDLLESLEGEIESHFRGIGDDFYLIRPYSYNDSARFVDWKASAHTGELQVREFARNQDREVEIMLDLNVPAGLNDWFEHAIDCAAFLCWNLAQEGIRLRLRTQDVDLQVPGERDVYAILKYLALVSPLFGKLPSAVHDPSRFQILLTAQPSRFPDSGSPDGVRVLGPHQLPVAGANAHRPTET